MTHEASARAQGYALDNEELWPYMEVHGRTWRYGEVTAAVVEPPPLVPSYFLYVCMKESLCHQSWKQTAGPS